MKKLMMSFAAAVAATNLWAIQGTLMTETETLTGDIKWHGRDKQYVIEKGKVTKEFPLADVTGLDIPKPAGYDKAVQAVENGQVSVWPNGASLTDFAGGSRGTDPFSSFIRHQEEKIVLLSTGGTLTSLAQADTGSLFYLRFTEMVEKYLYDPNSPLRNEDLFLPFVEELAECPFTDTLMRTGYRYMAAMCALNPAGSPAPDFRFKDISGRIHSLYGTKGEYTMLFFSNPGCDACKVMIEDIDSCPSVSKAIADGRVALVNIYIDQEIDKWREYEPTYPRSWITGYDWLYVIRDEQIYDVRAIPSLYLLDSEKKIIMKDAPTERVLHYLDGKLLENQ